MAAKESEIVCHGPGVILASRGHHRTESNHSSQPSSVAWKVVFDWLVWCGRHSRRRWQGDIGSAWRSKSLLVVGRSRIVV
jgi:hypothetical protein